MKIESFADNFNPLPIGSSLEVVRYFIEEQGIEVNNAARKYGHTPLHWAVVHSSLDVMQYLVSQGADVNAKDYGGATPLHFATAAHCSLYVIQYLVLQGADLNMKDDRGRTPLHEAADRQSWRNRETVVGVLKYLISQGADVHAKDKDGQTPFDVAVVDSKKRFLRKMKYLISQGVDVHAKDKNGQTPFDDAVQDTRKDILREAMAR